MRTVAESARLVIDKLPFQNWCRGMMAMDARCQSADPDSPDAVAWCAWGAATVVLTAIEGLELGRAFHQKHGHTMSFANDLCGYDKLIEMLEALCTSDPTTSTPSV